MLVYLFKKPSFGHARCFSFNHFRNAAMQTSTEYELRHSNTVWIFSWRSLVNYRPYFISSLNKTTQNETRQKSEPPFKNKTHKTTKQDIGLQESTALMLKKQYRTEPQTWSTPGNRNFKNKTCSDENISVHFHLRCILRYLG